MGYRARRQRWRSGELRLDECVDIPLSHLVQSETTQGGRRQVRPAGGLVELTGALADIQIREPFLEERAYCLLTRRRVGAGVARPDRRLELVQCFGLSLPVEASAGATDADRGNPTAALSVVPDGAFALQGDAYAWAARVPLLSPRQYALLRHSMPVHGWLAQRPGVAYSYSD